VVILHKLWENLNAPMKEKKRAAANRALELLA
jgi:hypothetical protein